MYISVSFQQINPLHYIYLPLLCPLPSRKVYQRTNRAHTQCPVLQQPSPQTLLSELKPAHIGTIIPTDTDTSVPLSEFQSPSSYPAPAPSEKAQALPPSPALQQGSGGTAPASAVLSGSFSSPLPAAAPAPFDSKAASRVTLQSENVNQAAGHRGKYKSGAYPQAVPRSLTS